MNTFRLALVAAFLGAVAAAAPTLAIATPMPALAGTQTSVSVDWPGSAMPGRPLVVTVTLPGSVAAVDGRLLFDPSAAELLGIAPTRRGQAFLPARATGGASFGAFDLRPLKHPRRTVIGLVVVPAVVGRLQMRVVIDAAADRSGHRLSLGGSASTSATGATSTIEIGASGPGRGAPLPSGTVAPLRPAGPTIEPLSDLVADARDLDTVRIGWEAARDSGTVCGVASAADVNGDGCVDIVDVQAVLAAQGSAGGATTPGGSAAVVSGRSKVSGAPKVRAAAYANTFVVNSAVDDPDALIGDGICADALGRCTLRAALAEADALPGDDLIDFDIAGPTPASIRISSASRLPPITSRDGTVTIDGYSQPGSQVNTALNGSNAIPGVEIRGNGSLAGEVGLEFTSPGNTVRGLLIDSIWRGIVLDGTDAHDNTIVGNWIGFHIDQTTAGGQNGILLDVGANHNQIGGPALADRNVLGNWSKAVYSYGPGTDFNTVQGNLICIQPNGGTATCGTGIDHDFGPKNALIGGPEPADRNVIGPTTSQGIEFSHGWDPSLPWGTDTATTWQIDHNSAIGNWVGFREDGSYDPAYLSGLNLSSTDNGEAINVYDGSNDNLIQGNWIGTVYDGIQVMAPNAQGNMVRGNIIGLSPLGQPAPLSGWGIKFDTIVGNSVHNAAAGGIGLLTTTNTGSPQPPAYNITISQNIVSDTLGPAIYLMPTLADPTKGSNNLTASPVITAATTAAVTGTATNGATVEVYRATRPIGQSGLPSAYLGSTIAGANGTWSFPSVGLAVGDLVTALQIRTDLNTSALSTNAAVTVPITPPGPGDPIASDSFARTVTGGWGTADLGGTYAYTGTLADFSVAGGVGLISAAAGQSREARLNVATDNVNVAGTLSFDRVPTGGNAFAYILARSNGTTAYRAAIRVATSGAVYVQLKKSVGGVESAVAPEVAVPGLSAAAANKLGFRFEVVGTHLQFRVWAATGTEPTTWQTSADDATAGLTGPGAIGLRVYTGSPVTNGPVSVLLGNLSVHRSDVIASDDFERTVAGGWGTATYGGAWSPTGTAADFSVANAAGRIVNAAGQSHEARLAVSYADVSVAGQVSFDRLPTSGNAYAYVLARGNGTTSYRATIRVVAGGAVFIQLKKAVGGIESNVAAEVAVPGISAAASAQIAFRFEVIGTHLQFRVWAGGAPEPTTWLTSADDTTAGLGGIGSVGLRTYLGSPVPNGPVTVSLDAFEVRRP